MANIKQNKNGTFRIRISTGVDSNGKYQYYTETFTPNATTPKAAEKEALKHAQELENSIQNGTFYNLEKLTLQDFFEKWEKEYAASYLTQAKVEYYSATMRRVFLPKLGKVKISKINAMQLQDIVTELNNKGLTPQTVRTYFNSISSILTKAYKLGIIAENPVKRVTFEKMQTSDDLHVFTVEQCKTFLSALNEEYISRNEVSGRIRNNHHVKGYTQVIRISIATIWRTYFTMALFTGLRRGEMLSLQWSDIDFNNMTVSVTKSTASTKAGQVIKEPKTKAGRRVVSLPLPVITLLKQWQTEQAAVNQELGNDDTGFIFTQEDGTQMHLSSPTHKFREILDMYNASVPSSEQLPIITLHDLRHCTASLLISAGADVATVSRMLGHSKISMTLDRYTHAIRSDRTLSNTLTTLLADDEERPSMHA